MEQEKKLNAMEKQLNEMSDKLDKVYDALCGNEFNEEESFIFRLRKLEKNMFKQIVFSKSILAIVAAMTVISGIVYTYFEIIKHAK